MDLNNEGYFATQETQLIAVNNYSHLLSRKFIIAFAAILSASLLVAFRLIADGVYATVMIATVGAYLTANVTQKINANAANK